MLPLVLDMQVPLVVAAGALVAVAVVVGALAQHKTLVEILVHGQQVLRKMREELLVLVGGRVQLKHGGLQVRMQHPGAVGGHLLNRVGPVLLNKPVDGTYDWCLLSLSSINRTNLIDICDGPDHVSHCPSFKLLKQATVQSLDWHPDQ
jgi:hypothetical protein